MTVTIVSGATDTQNATVLYQNIFEEGSVTVSSETADGAGLNCIEDTTFDFWTASSAYSTITVDMGSAVECDCIGVAAHNIGLSGARIGVEYSDDNITYNATGFLEEPLIDDTILGVFSAVSARYWRVYVSNGPASIGVIKLGKRLVYPSGVLSGYTPINHANRVDLMTNTSIKGQYLGTRIKRVGADTNVNFGLIDTNFVDNDMAVFESHFNSGRSFFYAGSPSEWPEDYGYCWRSGGEIRPSLEEGGVLSQVNMDVSVYVEQ